MDNEGVTSDEFAQSTRNFLRLIRSIEEQTTMERPAILESAMAAVTERLIGDLGHETTAELLRNIADKIEAAQSKLDIN